MALTNNGNVGIPVNAQAFKHDPYAMSIHGMVSFALVSIGAQLASAKLHRNTSAVLASSLVRLVISPLCACALIALLHIRGITAQALLIASAIPTSRNSASLALEYGNEPGFAAQAVLVSTILSSVTLAVIINLAQSLF